MNRNTKGQIARASAALAALAVVSTPGLAFAETDSASIMIPKLSEFIPALVAFIIIWIVGAKVAWPSILAMMEKRQNKIADDLAEAEKSRSEAAAQLEQRKAEVVEIERKADELIAQATKEAEAQRAAIVAQAQREAAEIIAKAEDAVKSERHKAMIELSTSVVDLSVEIAGKIIGNALSVEQQRELAQKYLQEVGTNDDH